MDPHRKPDEEEGPLECPLCPHCPVASTVEYELLLLIHQLSLQLAEQSDRILALQQQMERQKDEIDAFRDQVENIKWTSQTVRPHPTEGNVNAEMEDAMTVDTSRCERAKFVKFCFFEDNIARYI